MKHSPNLTAIVGLQYGDEGKGQVVDALCRDYDMVVRYNGGANAGHNVCVGNESFVLHQVPVGALTPGRRNVLASGVVLSADALIEEMDRLESAGIDLDGLTVSDRAHVVMPWHQAEEQLRHKIAARMLGEAGTLGTTFKGIGPCYADKASRDTAVRVVDLFSPSSLRRRLDFIVLIKNAVLRALSEEASAPFEPLDAGRIASQCEAWAQALAPRVADTAEVIGAALSSGKRVLFEGANAALLDIDFGTYPFVTSSNGSTLGIESGTGVAVSGDIQRIGVAKAYMSRVGNGPFVTELFGDDADRLRELGREYGSTTGRPRRIGWLDLPALKHVVDRNRINAVVMTGLSVLAALPRFRVCTHYEIDGRRITALPASVDTMAQCVPVYEEFNVDGPLTGSTLPQWTRALIELIEAEGIAVSGFCVGRRRDQINWLREPVTGTR